MAVNKEKLKNNVVGLSLSLMFKEIKLGVIGEEESLDFFEFRNAVEDLRKEVFENDCKNRDVINRLIEHINTFDKSILK